MVALRLLNSALFGILMMSFCYTYCIEHKDNQNI